MQVLKAPQAQVLNALQSVAGIVERRHTLPILANVLLRKHGETLQLITSDLEIQIRTTAELGGDPGDFSTTETAAYLNLNALCAELHCSADSLFKSAAERNSSFKLTCDILCYKLRIKVGLLDFYDIDENVFVSTEFCFAYILELLDLSTALTDNHTGLSAVNVDADSLGISFDFDLRNACGSKSAE